MLTSKKSSVEVPVSSFGLLHLEIFKNKKNLQIFKSVSDIHMHFTDNV